MLGLPASVRVYLAADACDMRRGFDALAARVKQSFGDDPLSGHIFIFRSRRGDRLKMLWWDRDGYALWYKRLEQGTFKAAAFDAPQGTSRIELSRRDLTLLLEGIDLKHTRVSKRFSLPKT